MAVWSLIFFWPVGIFAIISAARVKPSVASGKPAAAQKASSRVKVLFWISVAIVVVLAIIIGIAAAKSNSPSYQWAFSSGDLAGLKDVDGFGQLPGAPGAAAGWAAPRFPDRWIAAISRCGLRIQVIIQDFLGSPVAKTRMKTLPIITDLYVPCNVIPRFLPGRVGSTVDALDFHRRVERLSESTMPFN
jgi:Interferon-induced transmembrane protein